MRVFADAVGSIQVFGQVVRIDLLAAEPGPEDKEAKGPRMGPAGQLVMPLEGFLRAYGAMGQMMQQLAKAGVIKPGADNGASAPALTQPAAEPQPPAARAKAPAKN